MKYLRTFFTLVIIYFCSCSSTKPTMVDKTIDLAKNHKTIAIFPPQTLYKKFKELDYEKFRDPIAEEQKELHRIMWQEMMYYNSINSWNLKIIKPERILEVLEEFPVDSANFDLKFYAETLEVDAIILSKARFSKPVGDGYAAATLIFSALTPYTLGSPPTNSMKQNMWIYDKKSESEIWSLEDVFEGNLGSSRKTLMSKFFRKTHKKIPYHKKQQKAVAKAPRISN